MAGARLFLVLFAALVNSSELVKDVEYTCPGGHALPHCTTALTKPGAVLMQLAKSTNTVGTVRATKPGSAACAVKVAVGKGSLLDTRCERGCPYYVEVVPCTFACVNATQCGSFNRETPVADRDQGVCRGCNVRWCKECALDGTDTCRVCSPGTVLVDGACWSKATRIWIAVYAFIGALLLVIIGWSVNLCCRPVVNKIGVDHGLSFRERCKLHRVAYDADASGPAAARGEPRRVTVRASRELWPLRTNLLRQDVAGVGSLLFFNFQLGIILWGAAVLLAWLALSVLTSTELLTLGLTGVETSRDYCIVVQWGYASQRHLSLIKESFVLGVYVFSFAAALYFAARNHWIYEEMDKDSTTMKDFAALCTGLPPLEGSGKWEDRLKERLEEVTGEQLVGVSICWDYQSVEGPIMAELKRIEREEELKFLGGAPPAIHAQDEGTRGAPSQRGGPGLLSRFLHRRETALLGWITEASADPPDDVHAALASLRSTKMAFAVFRTESGRLAALVKTAELRGFEFEGRQVRLRPVSFEPASVLLQNAGFEWYRKLYRLVVGVGVIFLALAVWTGAFYLPYANYMISFTSARGTKPNALFVTSFSLMVVIGNQIMYCVCREVATRVGFKVQGELETCYMVLYSVAILFNIVVDLIVAYSLAYMRMMAAGVRTHDGRLLSEVHGGTEIFNSYVMQKALGHQYYSYLFPATVLLPYLFEPVMLYFLPLRVMKSMVGRHAEIDRFQAEVLFRAMPMDLGRYGDVFVNVCLVSLVFLFPGGYTVLSFGALVISHIYIYCYDHWRVLRVVPSFCVSTFILSHWSSALLALPCGILLSTVVFKTNCNGRHLPCTPDESTLYLRCLGAFVAHVAMHSFLIVFVMPWFSGSTSSASESTFEECSRQCACSWFTANPVHCLRSKYIYGHSPPCNFHVTGKEHLMRANRAIGQYFATTLKEEPVE